MPVKIDGAFFDINSASGDVLNELKSALFLDYIDYYGFARQGGARVGRDPRPYDAYREPPLSRILSNPERLYYDAVGRLWTSEGERTALPYDPHDYDTVPQELGPGSALNRHGWVYNFSCRADYLNVSNSGGRLRFERDAAAPTTLDFNTQFKCKRVFRGDRGFDWTWEFREIPNVTTGTYLQRVAMGNNLGLVQVQFQKDAVGGSYIGSFTYAGAIVPPVSIPAGTTELDIHFSWDPSTSTMSFAYTTGGVTTSLGSYTFSGNPVGFLGMAQGEYPNYDAGLPGNLVSNLGPREPIYHPERNAAPGQYAADLTLGFPWIERTAGPWGALLASWTYYVGGAAQWEDLGDTSAITDPTPITLFPDNTPDIEGEVQVGAGIYVDPTTSRRMLHWQFILDESRMEWQEELVSGLSKYRGTYRGYNIPLPAGLDEDDIFLDAPAMINGAACLVFGVKYASGDGQEGIYILDFHADALLHITPDGAFYEMTGIGSQMLHGFFTQIPTTYLAEEFSAPALVRDHAPAAAKPACVHSAAPTADLSRINDLFLLNRQRYVSKTQPQVTPHASFAFQVSYADMGTLLVTGYQDVQVACAPVALQNGARRWGAYATAGLAAAAGLVVLSGLISLGTVLVQEPQLASAPVTPQIRTADFQSPADAPIEPARLTSYLVAHGDYAGGLSRQVVSSHVVTGTPDLLLASTGGDPVDE